MADSSITLRVLSTPVIRDTDLRLIWLREIWINNTLHAVKVSES